MEINKYKVNVIANEERVKQSLFLVRDCFGITLAMTKSMKNLKLKVLVLFATCHLLPTACFAQQDPQYSQYMFNQLAINPAYAGSKEALSAVMDLRKQWINMPGSPQTGSLSFHGPLAAKALGLGGHMVAESIGPTSWTAAYLDAAYRLKLGKGKLSLGLSGGFVNYRLDVAKLDYKDGSEPIGSYTGQRTAFDVSTGFYYYSPSFYIGGSITHLNKPNLYKDASTVNLGGTNKNVTLFFNLDPHSFLYLGKGFKVNDNLVFSPSVMLKGVAGQGQMDLNFNFLLKQKMWLGISLRSGYGIVALFQLYVTNQFKVGYAYDQGLNRIGLIGQSTHEIMLSYDFTNLKTKMLSPRYL